MSNFSKYQNFNQAEYSVILQNKPKAAFKPANPSSLEWNIFCAF